GSHECYGGRIQMRRNAMGRAVRFGSKDALSMLNRCQFGERNDKMKLPTHYPTWGAMIMLLATAALGQEVKTDYDRSASFSQYKTFSWQNVKTHDQLMVDRIKSAVNSALAAKGWRAVPSDGDAAIVAIESTHEQQTLDTFYDGFGGGWRWRGFGGVGEAT